MRHMGRISRFAALGGLAAAGYALSRDKVLNWGATEEEAAAELPGDELLPDAEGVTTRAIDIAAPAASVWPWIVQIGPAPRAGAYTYDWIENLLGLEFHSADRIIPEFQNPRVGDEIEFGSTVMRLARVDPQRVLTWLSDDGRWAWSFVLNEQGGVTRLVSRNRIRIDGLPKTIAVEPMIPASLVMEQKMLKGIKQRAERNS